MLVFIIFISILTVLVLLSWFLKRMSNAKLESEINRIKIPDDTFDDINIAK